MAATVLFAQPQPGAAKRKANELKEKTEPEKKDKKPDEPVVFAMGPDKKSHYEIDEASKRNVIKFESKVPAETIESKVGKVTGFLDLNPRKMDKVEGKFTVAWKDVDTGNKMRNGHLMGKQWVDAESYPEIVFTVTGIEGASAKDKPIKMIKCSLVGKMALHGKEREMKIPVTLSYMEVLPGVPKKGEAAREGLAIKAGKFKIALKDFDIKGNGSIGKKVAEEQEFTTVSFMLTGPEHATEKKAGAGKPVKKPPPGA